MNVNVIGGGPGGLYAALLLKKGHPNWTVRVYERNPRGATFGWGVVFSDRTLEALREADLPTFEQITESFVLWDAIDVHIHGELLRCNGHAFAGIGRKHLLEILNRRCEELGVELRHEHPVDDLTALPEAGLTIAANGVNSFVRERFADRFQPRITLGKARYIWFGTERVYDAFTFAFVQDEHGIFQAHAYPYDERTSTFIVECRGETWERTGLAEDNEVASVQFCERLFADHLAGKRLMSNHSPWLRFPTLRTDRWSADIDGIGPVVLLGDAAHTAHFSIGSGTKLALEDAIALAEAFQRHDGVPAALRDYEQARRPRVQVLQEAAEESRDYFEHIARYYPLHPQQFTYHLLTRSGRITTDNLRTRDPHFVAQAEAWFAAQRCDGERSVPTVAPPPAFTPLEVRAKRFPNRLVIAEPAGLAASDGLPGVEHRRAYLRLAESGAGAILTSRIAASPEGRITPEDAGLYADKARDRWARLVASVHERSDALVIAHISHAGRRGATRPRRFGIDLPLRRDGWELLAPSPLPYLRVSATPREMTAEDLERVQDDFLAAAQRAADAGFDALLLDMAHGYLLSSFLSPLTNRRDDDYGGDLERRMRYPLAVLDSVRAVWPEERPLLVGLNASDRARGGLSPADAVWIAGELRARGVDMLAVHAGQVVPGERHGFAPGSLARLSDELRNQTGIPTLATAYMDTTNMPNTLLASGRADLCLFQPRGWRS